MAGVVGATVEALTVVVAAHELSHAYTHLGRDIDGRCWDTEAFAHAETGMVEGLAQFYTALICDKLEPCSAERVQSLAGISIRPLSCPRKVE